MYLICTISRVLEYNPINLLPNFSGVYLIFTMSRKQPIIRKYKIFTVCQIYQFCQIMLQFLNNKNIQILLYLIIITRFEANSQIIPNNFLE